MHDDTHISQEIPSARVLIAAGGTGGHVYPAIAIADALTAANSSIKIRFVGTKNHTEWVAVPRAGYTIDPIWISGFHRRFTLKNVLFPVKLVTSLLQSWRIIKSFKPDAIVSCGGYVAGPVGWTATKKGVPLFIQEQNSFPGITNRLLAKKAAEIFTAFEGADEFFPKGKTMLTGNPMRQNLANVNSEKALEHFGFIRDRNTLLVLGGSGGAKSINETMAKNLAVLHDEMQLQIIWQCGAQYISNLEKTIDPIKYKRLRLTKFLHHMPQAYAAATLVVSRAGALSCSELALTGSASILIPSPNVAGDHQTKNAQSMTEHGAAELLKDINAKDLLPKLVNDLMDDQQRLKAMQQAALKMARPNAAKVIAQKILETIKP